MDNHMHQDLAALIKPVTDIAVHAGDKILEIYATDFEVEIKSDASPLTAADKASHNAIVAALTELTQDSPIQSEESDGISWADSSEWPNNGLIGPRDGNKE